MGESVKKETGFDFDEANVKVSELVGRVKGELKKGESEFTRFRTELVPAFVEWNRWELWKEALLNLGFYFGEEDMEFSSFSTGTEHAVKTWQAAIGIREDGIMTTELLERLYMKQQFEDGGTNSSADQEATTMFP